MGYSCTAIAAEVLRTFRGNEEQSSNGWKWKGNKYFFERGRENADGAITGSIYRRAGKFAERAGSYRINADGTIHHADKGMITCLSERDGIANYLKVYEPKEAWRKACEWDQVDPSSAFIVFSPENPYA